ncbi:hypothetical protein, partial [Glycomyces halotolerans]
ALNSSEYFFGTLISPQNRAYRPSDQGVPMKGGDSGEVQSAVRQRQGDLVQQQRSSLGGNVFGDCCCTRSFFLALQETRST